MDYNQDTAVKIAIFNLYTRNYLASGKLYGHGYYINHQ